MIEKPINRRKKLFKFNIYFWNIIRDIENIHTRFAFRIMMMSNTSDLFFFLLTETGKKQEIGYSEVPRIQVDSFICAIASPFRIAGEFLAKSLDFGHLLVSTMCNVPTKPSSNIWDQSVDWAFNAVPQKISYFIRTKK